MKLFLVKTNKMYESLDELPIQKPQKGLKRQKNQLLCQLDHFYQFFYQGQQLSAQDINALLISHSNPQQFIIVITKLSSPLLHFRPSYQSHRQTIQKYIKETKTNQKQKIRQNGEFIFENAIDGNFKYHTFEYFELEKEFTEDRKAELMNEVFQMFCESEQQQISLVERKKKRHQIDMSNNSKQQQVQSHQNISRRQILQLHQLEYINQNWKELLCVNKDLLKTNLDNLKYYAQLRERRHDSAQVEGMNEGKMEIENRSEKVVNQLNSAQYHDVEI